MDAFLDSKIMKEDAVVAMEAAALPLTRVAGGAGSLCGWKPTRLVSASAVKTRGCDTSDISDAGPWMREI